MPTRTAEDETLRKTICGLLLQLGSSNPVTNGVAFMQVGVGLTQRG